MQNYMPLFGKLPSLSMFYFRVWHSAPAFLVMRLIYKSPILLKFSSNGGLAHRGWGLFSTISLILVIIFHYNCRKYSRYLRHKCLLNLWRAMSQFLKYLWQMLLTTSISYQWCQVYPDDTTIKRTRGGTRRSIYTG